MKRIIVFLSLVFSIIFIPYCVGMLISKWEFFTMKVGLTQYISTMTFGFYWIVGWVVCLFIVLVFMLWILTELLVPE